MSNDRELFTEIIPSKAANISGGCGGSQNRDPGSLNQSGINVEAFATANVFGLDREPRSTVVGSYTNVSISKRGIFAFAVSFVRILF